MSTHRFFLIGLPGSGKTTLGKKLAKKRELSFIDLDEEIERAIGKSIPEIFSDDGEDKFRLIESNCLKEIIYDKENFVLATGGGTPCFFNNMQLMNESGVTVYINTPVAEIRKRLENDSSRPLMKIHSIEELHKLREVWYKKAHRTIQHKNQITEI
ncbi:MAG: shikimate kinase [Cyclobacteriaceae bacterium]